MKSYFLSNSILKLEWLCGSSSNRADMGPKWIWDAILESKVHISWPQWTLTTIWDPKTRWLGMVDHFEQSVMTQVHQNWIRFGQELKVWFQNSRMEFKVQKPWTPDGPKAPKSETRTKYERKLDQTEHQKGALCDPDRKANGPSKADDFQRAKVTKWAWKS